MWQHPSSFKAVKKGETVRVQWPEPDGKGGWRDGYREAVVVDTYSHYVLVDLAKGGRMTVGNVGGLKIDR